MDLLTPELLTFWRQCHVYTCYRQLAIWLMHQILFYSRHSVSEGCSTMKDLQKYIGAEITPHKPFTCQILCLATGFCSLIIQWLLTTSTQAPIGCSHVQCFVHAITYECRQKHVAWCNSTWHILKET